MATHAEQKSIVHEWASKARCFSCYNNLAFNKWVEAGVLEQEKQRTMQESGPPVPELPSSGTEEYKTLQTGEERSAACMRVSVIMIKADSDTVK